MMTSQVVLRKTARRSFRATRPIAIKSVVASNTNGWSIMMKLGDIKLLPDFTPASHVLGSGLLPHPFSSPLFMKPKQTFLIEMRNDEKEKKHFVLGLELSPSQ